MDKEMRIKALKGFIRKIELHNFSTFSNYEKKSLEEFKKELKELQGGKNNWNKKCKFCGKDFSNEYGITKDSFVATNQCCYKCFWDEKDGIKILEEENNEK